MLLEETAEMMLSEDYKDRFKAEYYQTAIRAVRLGKIISDYYLKRLDFTLSCDISLLEIQLNCMFKYLDILKERARVESIEL